KSGYANGTGENPSYESVMTGKGNFAETVKVTFDPERVSVDELLTYFFRVIDPTVKDQQGNDIGVQYRTGIYYDKNSHKHITEDLPHYNFYLAEEIHQDYLEKNPDGYCHINLEVLNDIKINPNKYQAKDKTEMKDQLTREQFTVIMENETETAYENKYWDTFDPGIYVDVTTGEPLFSSNTKYDAQSGWPSFTKPIDIEAVNFSKDNSANMERT